MFQIVYQNLHNRENRVSHVCERMLTKVILVFYIVGLWVFFIFKIVLDSINILPFVISLKKSSKKEITLIVSIRTQTVNTSLKISLKFKKLQQYHWA